VFSETMAEVVREAKRAGCEWELFMAHSRPIPACFNEPINDAIWWGATHVWVVEEDMALPEGILAELFAAVEDGHPIVAADYPVADGRVMCVNRDADGKVRHTGTGCLLAEVEALRAALPFRADIAYRVNREWEPFIIPPAMAQVSYGMHDVHFGMTLYQRGTPIHVVPTICNQRVIVREAVPKRNQQGWHDIRLLPIPA
jgi:hypothetical protein